MRIILMISFCILLSGCGAPAAAQRPEPTPLPAAPALERPTYSVQRGTVEQSINTVGRLSPVDLERLAFQTSGRVAEVAVRRGDLVRAGDVLATISQNDAHEALRRAELNLERARNDLAAAERRQSREAARAELGVADARRSLDETQARLADDLRNAELELARAQADLDLLLQDSGPQSLIEQADRAVAAAQQSAREQLAAASEAKTRAEHAQIAATEAVQLAQRRYSDALWDNDWVQRYGTHPREKVPNPTTGVPEHRPLEAHEREQFARAFADAERALQASERDLELAIRAVELAREAEQVERQRVEQALADAERAAALLREGRGSTAVEQARRRVEDAALRLTTAQRANAGSQASGVRSAELSLAATRDNRFEVEQAQIADAEFALEQAQRSVAAGQIRAPRDGVVLAISIGIGDMVEPFAPVIELGDPSQLEVATELSADQMRLLAEGMPAEIRLAAGNAGTYNGNIRRLPAPYGSGGSGAVAEQDRSTRISLDLPAEQRTLGGVVRIRIVVEQRTDTLWLPPEAIRAFEGRRFVIVREGERERRVPVRVGIESDERVEILEGLDEGAVVVGA